MYSLLFIILALLGLTFLVFIHEFGHYVVAKRQKMKIKTFSIGFGKPLISWTRKGVKWQICLILIGGYVKIAGMEKEGEKEPHEVPQGFYSKRPWSRIKVALAGPLVNLIFAFIAFACVWGLGGRKKEFSNFTHLIGAIDPQSELYANGVRPGDEITEYNKEQFKGYMDLIYAAIVNGRPANIEGNKINYFKETKTPYDYVLTPYESPLIKRGFKTIGVLSPASYLIYDKDKRPWHGIPFSRSPMHSSDIKSGDRLVWVDGELVFSEYHLAQILNSRKALLTVQRGEKRFLVKVPKLPITDLRLSEQEATEFVDWQHEAGLSKAEKGVLFIPYILDSSLTVEKGLFFVDKNSKITHVSQIFPTSLLDTLLEPNDQIIAVDGIPVSSIQTFLKSLQTRRIQMIVKHEEKANPVDWKQEDKNFENETSWNDLLPMIGSIGLQDPLRQSGQFRLLNPVTPMTLKEVPLPQEKKEEIETRIKKQIDEINKIVDSSVRESQLEQIKKYQNQLMLGVSFQDKEVIYNPNPFTLYNQTFREIARNLTALVSGHFSPKYLAGPVFIVQVMKESWGIGLKEALFWLGTISLNLGMLNLLPIPILDGGHICLSVIEKIRGKPIKAKVMHWIMFPFVILLVFFFIYMTYNDLSRIFGRML